MTQRISKKTGRTYTVGSSPAWADWQPKTCWACGEKIVKSRAREAHGLGFHFDDISGAVYSWHFTCAKGPPPTEKRAA